MVLLGRKEIQCKDVLSGVRYVWLFSFKYYEDHLIFVDEGVKLNSYPTTPVYKYMFRGDFAYNESRNQEGEWQQEVSFNFPEIVKQQAFELARISDNRVGCIVLDRNGNKRLLGLRSGCNISFNETTGNSKGSFSGYEVTITATEEYSSPFIDDLTDAGFTPEVDVENIMLASTDVLASTDKKCSEIVV